MELVKEKLEGVIVIMLVVLELEGKLKVGGINIVDILDVPEGVPQLIPCTQQRGGWSNT